MNTIVRTTVDETVKQEADAVLSQLGLTVGDVVRMTLARVAEDGALPFEIKVPNKATQKAMRDGRALLKAKKIRFQSAEALNEALETEVD